MPVSHCLDSSDQSEVSFVEETNPQPCSRLFASPCFCTFCSFPALQDRSSPDDQIQVQLVSVPMYGTLTRSQSQQEPQELREYSSFTMEDISKQRVR